MNATGLTVRTTSQAPAPGRVRGVSALVPWRLLQPSSWYSFAADVLAPLDGVLSQLHAHGGWCVLRVLCGANAPAWLIGPASSENGHRPAASIKLLHRNANGSLADITIPLPWSPGLLYHYTWMMRELAQWASQPFDSSGVLRSDVLAFVPVSMPCDVGTEMTLTTQGIAENETAWAAAAPGSSPTERQGFMLDAWEAAMHAHDAILGPLGVRSAIALGSLLGDNLRGAYHLLDTDSWQHTYPMVTNLRVGADGRTYRSWSAQWANLLQHAASVAGPTVCQTAGQTDSGGHPGLSPAHLPAAVLDAADNYRCCIVETYGGAVGAQTDAELHTLELMLSANGVTA